MTAKRTYPVTPAEQVVLPDGVKLYQRDGRMVAALSAATYYGWCEDCPQKFTNAGATLSHGRAARHVVKLTRQTEPATYVPAERLNLGGKR